MSSHSQLALGPYKYQGARLAVMVIIGTTIILLLSSKVSPPNQVKETGKQHSQNH
jgi:hypothetical protein